MSTKINNGLFMGDVDAAQDADFLGLNGIELVVNCVPREMPNVFEGDGIQYFVWDMAEDPDATLFDLRNQDFVDLIAFIDGAMERSHSLLVHSMEGLSRSPCVMMSYLMAKYHWSLDKAFAFVKIKRADINPHPGYLDQLASLDAQLQAKHGGRVPPQKRCDWNPDFADPATDELVLVHTFLNVTSTAGSCDDNRARPKAKSKKSLLWLDLCPRLRKMHPEYDFSKLERPPSASYSSLAAGDGWVDLEVRRRGSIEARPVQDVDLTLTDDDEAEPAKPAQDSWDISYSDPGVGHDADPKSCRRALIASRDPCSVDDDDGRHGPRSSQRRGSKAPPGGDGNQHSPTQNEQQAPPRYLQHTKSSRNAKLVKLPQTVRRGSVPTKADALGDLLQRFKLDEDKAVRAPARLPVATKTKGPPPRPRTAPSTKTKASLMQNVIRAKGSVNAVNPATQPVHATSTRPRPRATPVYGWAEKKAPGTKKPEPKPTRQAGNRVTPAKWR
ncbi:hypothetical protein ACHHYP_04617 [Achlya hypogyna]|uniref:Dual specificity phosphatase n=1 Tax=Achlya hypogyna TaxID=1202772 RepID=A0A1V9ZP32_ACHHY|nr:hypothetical protein ACHHYP_04617 [Achlya hypogyna]